jgi:hypothetical protein
MYSDLVVLVLQPIFVFSRYWLQILAWLLGIVAEVHSNIPQFYLNYALNYAATGFFPDSFISHPTILCCINHAILKMSLSKNIFVSMKSLNVEGNRNWFVMYVCKFSYYPQIGHGIAQAVSHWLPTAAAWVRAQLKSCAIRGGQSGAGASFLRGLRFPLLILIPPTAPHSSSSIIRGWYNRPINGSLSPHPRN